MYKVFNLSTYSTNFTGTHAECVSFCKKHDIYEYLGCMWEITAV